MDGQALAGEYAGATANMEAIARWHAGADVRVTWQPSPFWLGLARRAPDGLQILLNPAAAAADLGYIFFHELGHLVCGHAVTESMYTPAEMAHDDTAARLERLTPPERASWGAAIDARETQADSWAWAALGAFQRRFGPFLKAIG